MRITRVIIQNWRSIKEVDFHPSDMTVLIGPNNAGKTNILSAINFLIGERYPMPGNLSDNDYYGGDRSRRLYISLHFSEAPYSRLEFDSAAARYNLQAYDNRGTKVYGFTNVQREDLAFAYVDAGRSFERQFGTSRFSLFGQAIRHLHNDLRMNADKETMPRLNAALQEAHNLLRTDLYKNFETSLRDAFKSQLKNARYDVEFEFRTLDETNLYRGLYPTLIDRGEPRPPTEVGSGVRNLLVLALFHACADAFKGGAVLGIEEPELYLHPHAQRSLMAQFEGIVAAGNQLFISSHSATFLDITNSERIVLVERCFDEEDSICTQVHTTTPRALLAARQKLHPTMTMTIQSMQAFLRNVRTVEMAEAYFARVVVVVEGASEREALPILCAALGLNFDEEGISVVSADGKAAIDTLVHLYGAHDIKTYVIFDNDKELSPIKRASTNKTLCRLLQVLETDLPAAGVFARHAVLDGNWEEQIKISLETIHPDLCQNIETEARAALSIESGRNKPLVARYVAQQLASREIIPLFIMEIAETPF